MLRYKNEVWLTPNEASEKFNVSFQTIYYWIYTKQVELLDLEDPELPVTIESLRSKFHISESSLRERTRREWGPGIRLESHAKSVGG